MKIKNLLCWHSLLLSVLFISVCCSGGSSGGGNGDDDDDDLPLKNEYTYNGETKQINYAYYNLDESPVGYLLGNRYKFVFAVDEMGSGDKYTDLDEYIYIEFVIGKHLTETKCDFTYSDYSPASWRVKCKFSDGLDFSGSANSIGRVKDGYVDLKILSEGKYRMTYNMKIDGSGGFGGGFRYVNGEYEGTFIYDELATY